MYRFLKDRDGGDLIFKSLLFFSATFILLLIVAITITLIIQSIPSIKHNGLYLLFGDTWDPVAEKYSILPFIIGTLITSILALLISIPFSLSASLFLDEYLEGKRISKIIKFTIDILADIPSIIYGF